MIKHTIPATNRQDSRAVTIEVITSADEKHAELRLSGSLRLLPSGDLTVAIDNESARALARSVLETIPAAPRRAR